MILSLLWFLFGLVLHVMAQVDAVARSKSNPSNTWLAVLKVRAVSYVVRAALCCAIFMLWLEGGLVAVLMATGITIPDSLAKVIALHITGALAVLAGYAADSVLGYIPFVNKIGIPAPDAT